MEREIWYSEKASKAINKTEASIAPPVMRACKARLRYKKTALMDTKHAKAQSPIRPGLSKGLKTVSAKTTIVVAGLPVSARS